MERNNVFKAVIFDLDGVITDSAKFHYMAWKELADELHIPFDETYNEKLKGVSRMESLDLILQNADQKQGYAAAQKEEMAYKKNERYKELIQQITPADILPGIETLLVELKENGVKTAVASVSKNAQFIIDRLDLNGQFDYVVDAAAVARAKPFPDIFLCAAEALHVPAAACIGIEDAEAGIQAINAAGMKSVGVGERTQMRAAGLILAGTEELSFDRLNSFFTEPAMSYTNEH